MTKQQKPPQQSTTSTASATVFTRQDSKLDNEEETTISTSVRSPPSPNNIYSESAISNPPYNLSTSVSGSKRRISSSAYSSSSAIPPHKPSSSKGKRTRPSGLISLIANAAWTERILWIAGIIAVGFGFHLLTKPTPTPLPFSSTSSSSAPTTNRFARSTRNWHQLDPEIKRFREVNSILTKPALNIHLIWTTGRASFRDRNYLVLDAYFYHHPDAHINIYSSTLTTDMFSNYTIQGYSVNITPLSSDFFEKTLSPKCPMASDWIARREEWAAKGKYYYSHITDYIRFCLLYSQGGLYSDFDAITLQRLDQHSEFIGRDSAMSNGTCSWCIFQNDIYLPPGVMATTANHPLPRRALEIGFADVATYNPDIFNSVGPMAVTKAYAELDRKSSSSGSPIKVLEQADLYPYNYLSSDYVFKTVEDAKGKFERLRRISLSLHLYGHQTRKLDMAPSSILKAASNMFSLSVFDAFSSYHGSNNRGVHASASKTFTIACPSYVQVAKYGIEEVADIRIKSLYTNARRPASSSTSASRKAMFAGHWKLTATTNNGGLLYVSGGGNTNVSSSTIMNKDDLMKLWSPKLEVTATSIADMNRKLSRLMYYGKSIEGGRDNITLAFEFHPEPRTTSSIQRETVKIPVYDVSSLVTIIVKTVGRIDKVIQLSESVRKFYSSIFILVADDDENIYRDEGMSREFYYLPLPNDVGLSAGRNRMIDRVDTDYFLTLDDDFTLDSTSRIGSLIHALETYPKTNRRGVGGGARNFSSSVSSSSSSHHHASSTDVTISSLFSEERFDIAGGKNPVDEGKFGLDFCGIMKLKGKTLHLEPGIYGTHADCNHVDFVPNIFLGRTSTFKQKIQWDELLKLGEHEDFFLRAKELGVKTLTCPSVTFLHDQVDHWLKRDKYEVKRSRVYDFWRLSLRKHGLEKLSSFGRIMMDLIDAEPISSIGYDEIFPHSIRLAWESQSPTFKIMYTEKGKDAWRAANDGQGLEYWGGNTINIYGLIESTTYLFKVFAGNRFSFETTGLGMEATTISRRKQDALNLLENGSFEKGHFGFNASIGGIYHIIRSKPASHGRYVGRIQILTKSYQSKTPTTVFISQRMDYAKINPTNNFATASKLNSSIKAYRRMISFSAYSKSEQLFGWTTWRIELHIWYIKNSTSTTTSPAAPLEQQLQLLQTQPDVVMKQEYDMSSDGWQVRVLSHCLSADAQIAAVEVRGYLESYRGSVYWDDWSLIETY